MNRRFFIVSFFTLVFAFNIALAQNQTGGAAQGVVLESVDEDIVDDEEIVSGTDASSSSESAQNEQKEKSDDGNDDESDELDIDKLLAGDEEEDLLAEDKPAVAENASIADSVSVDSLTKSAEALPDSQTAPQYRGRGRNESRRPQTAAAGSNDIVDSEPPVIEDGSSINFAHNLSEYRSPKMAMLLSLLVPGLGQAYSKSYIKAGAFGAAEIAAIGTAVSFNRAGKKKKREAYRYADEFFKINNLIKYDEGMRAKFEDPDPPPNKSFYFDTYFDTSFYNAADRKESYFYERIRDIHFAPGWENFEPGIDQILENSSSDDLSSWFGTSYRQGEYNSLMKESKSKYDVVNYVLYVVLLNHIASAIDAGFTAKAYNSHLLGKDNSVWERISVEQQFVFSGNELSPGAVLKIKF